jgi:hypothetical protein
MFKFDDSQETGNWLHQEAYAEFESGTLTSVQRVAESGGVPPTSDKHEDASEPRTSTRD